MDNQLFTFPARVMARAVTAELLEKAKAGRALDPSVFDESLPYFWGAEISSDRLDSYYTRMDAATTLKNYARDASDGLPFQDSHQCRRLPVGRSIAGAIEEGEVSRVVADFFTIRGLKLNDATYSTTDDYINAIRAGIASDVSVGFYFLNTDPEIFAGHRCDICMGDLFARGCFHIPGFEYEIENEGKTVRIIATATIINAHASEVSAVYSGATPGATIIKAQQEMDAGRLQPVQARLLEDRYRSIGLKLPDARHNVAVGNLSTKEGENMNELEIAQKQVADVRVVLKAASVPDDKPLDVAVRELIEGNTRALETEPPALFIEAKAILTRASITAEPKNTIEAMRLMESELTRLRPLADDGTRYKQDLIDAAVAEGRRAQGEKFKEETQRALLAKFDLDTIKETTEQWRAIGDVKFPGGRQTRDDEETPLPATTQSHDAAYRIS